MRRDLDGGSSGPLPGFPILSGTQFNHCWPGTIARTNEALALAVLVNASGCQAAAYFESGFRVCRWHRQALHHGTSGECRESDSQFQETKNKMMVRQLVVCGSCQVLPMQSIPCMCTAGCLLLIIVRLQRTLKRARITWDVRECGYRGSKAQLSVFSQARTCYSFFSTAGESRFETAAKMCTLAKSGAEQNGPCKRRPQRRYLVQSLQTL